MRRHLLLFALLLGCTSPLWAASATSPVPLVPVVDVPRFMGDWYVVASIPTFIEKGAYNAVESYRLRADGRIATTFSRRKNSAEGPVKTSHSTGFVVANTGNALWGMQFIWPFKGEYRIAHLEPDYSMAIIARSKLDYLWLLSRTPQISDYDYARYQSLVSSWGYDLNQLHRVPQQWPAASP